MAEHHYRVLLWVNFYFLTLFLLLSASFITENAKNIMANPTANNANIEIIAKKDATIYSIAIRNPIFLFKI